LRRFNGKFFTYSSEHHQEGMQSDQREDKWWSVFFPKHIFDVDSPSKRLLWPIQQRIQDMVGEAGTAELGKTLVRRSYFMSRIRMVHALP
jgi:hypothetical protein